MRPFRALSVILVCATGALAACNVVLGLDDLKDQIDAGAADTGAEDGGDGAVDAGPNCADYCSSIVKTCIGSNAQYVDKTTCLTMCAKLPLGDSALKGNTLTCRLANLQADASCASAGPYAPACGGEAENFCALYTLACGDAGGYGDCPSVFDGLTNPADAGGAFIPESRGNSRICREYQLEAAYQNGGGLFCLEASKDSVQGFCK